MPDLRRSPLVQSKQVDVRFVEIWQTRSAHMAPPVLELVKVDPASAVETRSENVGRTDFVELPSRVRDVAQYTCPFRLGTNGRRFDDTRGTSRLTRN